MVKLEEARKRNLQRETKSRNRDAGRTSKKVIDKDDPRSELWMKNQRRYDLAGVDTFGSRLTPMVPTPIKKYMNRYIIWWKKIDGGKTYTDDLKTLDASTIRSQILLGTLAFQVEAIAGNIEEVKILQPRYPHWLFYFSFILGGEHVRIDTLNPNAYSRIRGMVKKNFDGIGKDRLRSAIDYFNRVTRLETRVDNWLKDIESTTPVPTDEYTDGFYADAKRLLRIRKGTKLYEVMLEGTKPLLLAGYASDFKKEVERLEFQSNQITGSIQQVEGFGLQPRFLKVRVKASKALRLGSADLYRAWNLYVKSQRMKKEYIGRIDSALKVKKGVVKKLESRVTSSQVEKGRKFLIEFRENRLIELGKKK